jgi:hypothetical protein
MNPMTLEGHVEKSSVQLKRQPATPASLAERYAAAALGSALDLPEDMAERHDYIHGSEVRGERSDMPRSFLPHDTASRVLLGLVSAILIPLSVLLICALANAPAPANWRMQIVQVLTKQLFGALLFGSLCGLIWAVATPRWIPRLADRLSRRLTFALLLPFVIIWVL